MQFVHWRLELFQMFKIMTRQIQPITWNKTNGKHGIALKKTNTNNFNTKSVKKEILCGSQVNLIPGSKLCWNTQLIHTWEVTIQTFQEINRVKASFFLSRRANGTYRGLQKSFHQKNAANKLNQTGVHLATRGAKPSAGSIQQGRPVPF